MEKRSSLLRSARDISVVWVSCIVAALVHGACADTGVPKTRALPDGGVEEDGGTGDGGSSCECEPPEPPIFSGTRLRAVRHTVSSADGLMVDVALPTIFDVTMNMPCTPTTVGGALRCAPTSANMVQVSTGTYFSDASCSQPFVGSAQAYNLTTPRYVITGGEVYAVTALRSASSATYTLNGAACISAGTLPAGTYYDYSSAPSTTSFAALTPLSAAY